MNTKHPADFTISDDQRDMQEWLTRDIANCVKEMMNCIEKLRMKSHFSGHVSETDELCLEALLAEIVEDTLSFEIMEARDSLRHAGHDDSMWQCRLDKANAKRCGNEALQAALANVARANLRPVTTNPATAGGMA